MSQHDMNLANAAGAAFRADLNQALGALVSQSSGSTEPATTFAYQWWADTSSGWMKQRDADNLAWVNRWTIGQNDAADIASAATLDLTAAAGIVRVTGTTTTTAVNINRGQRVECVAVGAWPLTYHATNMPLPGYISYTCSPGDVVVFSRDNNGTKHVAINRASGANAPGEVLMYATAPTSWIVLNKNGVPLNLSGSTTSGLQEAIAYAYANGLNLRVLGGMATGSPEADYGIINCASSITWPPLRGCVIDLQGVIIAFSAAVTGDGMTFDSMQEVDFRLVGEVTYQGTGDAISFSPHTALPVDTTIGIGSCRIYIGAVACPGGTPDSCVHFDTTNGSIISMHFESEELNGAAAVGSPPKADYGIKVSVPSSSYAYEFNTIRVNAIHEVIVAGVQAGLSSTYADNIAANSYQIGQIQTNGTDAVGFNTFGDSDADVSIGLIQAIGGNLKWGVYLQTSSENNTISVGSILGATTAAVSDLGASNAVAYNGLYAFPQEDRINPTLAGTWANLGAGQAAAAYWKDTSGNVHLEGAVTSGGADTIFTLPTGYRPSSAQLFPVLANGALSYLQIATTGVVTCPAHTAVSLNGVVFRP